MGSGFRVRGFGSSLALNRGGVGAWGLSNQPCRAVQGEARAVATRPLKAIQKTISSGALGFGHQHPGIQA